MRASTEGNVPTPRTDSCYVGKWLVGDTNVEMVRADFARELERELIALQKSVDEHAKFCQGENRL